MSVVRIPRGAAGRRLALLTMVGRIDSVAATAVTAVIVITCRGFSSVPASRSKRDPGSVPMSAVPDRSGGCGAVPGTIGRTFGWGWENRQCRCNCYSRRNRYDVSWCRPQCLPPARSGTRGLSLCPLPRIARGAAGRCLAPLAGVGRIGSVAATVIAVVTAMTSRGAALSACLRLEA
jgi:hypothetical protein